MLTCVSCGYKKTKVYLCSECLNPVCHQCITEGLCKDCYTKVKCADFVSNYKYKEKRSYKNEI